MEWLVLLTVLPYAIIIVCLVKWAIKKLTPKPKRPKLRLIKGGRYYEREDGPYGKSR